MLSKDAVLERFLRSQHDSSCSCNSNRYYGFVAGTKKQGNIQFLMNLNPHWQEDEKGSDEFKKILHLHVRKRTCQLFGTLLDSNDDIPIIQSCSVSGCKFIYFGVWLQQ